MEQIKYFFENSTIHGLFYISSTRKCSKLFWTIVVITGFSCAFTLIQQAFDIWNESPISTTLEILPISRITFPNVTVCPPKNSVLDLNFDLQLAEKNKMDDYLRNKRGIAKSSFVCEGAPKIAPSGRNEPKFCM